jgi:hypothetical protein
MEVDPLLDVEVDPLLDVEYVEVDPLLDVEIDPLLDGRSSIGRGVRGGRSFAG